MRKVTFRKNLKSVRAEVSKRERIRDGVAVAQRTVSVARGMCDVTTWKAVR
jgi:hypothetical protein